MKINVSHVAKLANLPLTEEEIKKFEIQLSKILEYVKKLEEVDTKNVDPTSQVTGLENILRDDIPGESLPQDLVLSNSKSSHHNLFQVKGIFDNE